MATITLQGNQINTNGELPKIGDNAPDFVLVNSDMEDVSLSTYQGKKKLLSIVPSLDTPVCAISTKKFDQLAREKTNALFITISADLPFAMSRFCKIENLDNVITLSMMRSRNFAKDYGVLITDGPLAGITARAIIVLDEEDTVIHSELISEIADEPDYDTAIKILDAAALL
ncbi:MAG: thiol peroxidase [Pseudomonadota bacterium]|nr:thiol peroxidase [Pseudomonadota bacterium]|tara:strand:+ start:1686 stop:2201 length:516 start_codon:yes stop_codon:yes gene_type:complete